MRFWDLLRMSSSSLWKRKVRTVLTVLGVVIGTASIVVMISLGLGLNRSTMEQMESYGSLTTIEVNEGSGSSMSFAGGGMAIMTTASSGDEDVKRLDDELVEALKQIPHVKMVSPTLRTSVIIKSGVYEGQVSVTGMEPEYMQSLGIEVGQGELPVGKNDLEFFYGNQVLMDFYNSKTQRYPYYETGELPDIDLMNSPLFVIFDTSAYWSSQSSGEEGIDGVTPQPPKKYMIKTSGIAAGGPEEWNQHSYSVYCDIEQLKTTLKRIFKNKAIPGQPTTKAGKPYKEIFYNQILVDVDDIDYVAEVQTQINNMGYQTYSNAEWVESTQQQYANIQAMLGGIGAVALLVAAIGITNTMMMSIYERTKEIGVMKVLGCDMRNIQSLFLIEAAYIGLIGGLIGIGVSYGISAIINRAVHASGNEMNLSYIPGWLVIAAIIFAILIGMIAGYFPSRRAMKLSPLAAIRNE